MRGMRADAAGPAGCAGVYGAAQQAGGGERCMRARRRADAAVQVELAGLEDLRSTCETRH